MFSFSEISIVGGNRTVLKGTTGIMSHEITWPSFFNDEVYWYSSNPHVINIDSKSGEYTAYSVGSAVVTVKVKDGSEKQASCVVIVTANNGSTQAPVPVESIKLPETEMVLQTNESTNLHAIVSPTNATVKGVRWYTTDPNVADVEELAGCIWGVAPGTTKLYAVSEDGVSASDVCTVRVIGVQNAVDGVETEEKGTCTTPGSTVADPVDVYTGAHIIENNLISLFGGQGVSLKAHYNSQHLCKGSLGIGWYHNFEKKLVMGESEVRVYNGPTVYSVYVPTESANTFNCTTFGKNGYVLTINSQSDLPYCIDCNSERKEYYNSNGKIVKIVDRHGFETVIDYTEFYMQVTDMVTGKYFRVSTNAQGFVDGVVDNAGRCVTLSYNNDYLECITDVNNHSIKYFYGEGGRITAGLDEKKCLYFLNTYDAYGRVESQMDGMRSAPTRFEYGENGVREITNRNGHKSRRVFDANGMLISHTDENGNTRTYTYDSNGNRTSETDAYGRTVRMTYNRFNKPTEIVDRNDNKTEFTYDNFGNLIKISYPHTGQMPVEEEFAYNRQNQLAAHTDLRGTLTLYSYDVNGMPKAKKVGARDEIRYVYQNGLLMSETDARGTTYDYEYNDYGLMISKKDPYDLETKYEYDNMGNVVKIIAPDESTVEYTYDVNNQKDSYTDANGNTTHYLYNGNMKLQALYTPDGNCTNYFYDGEDRVSMIIDANDNVTVKSYDPAGRLETQTDADNYTVRFAYDKVGNVVDEFHPSGNVIHKTYDAMGNLLSVTDGESHTTSYLYDEMSRVTKVTNASGGTIDYTYSPAGDLLSEADIFNNTKRYTYDEYGNKKTFTDAMENTTEYTYDANNNLLSVKDPYERVTTYEYDYRNLCEKVTNARGKTAQYRYDSVGRNTSITDAEEKTIHKEYDLNGNIVCEIDAKGNVVKRTTYNSLNLVETVKDVNGATTCYTYNNLGRLQTVTDPFNKVRTYSYDNRGFNTSVVDAMGQTSSATFDSNGKITSLTGPMGAGTSYTYDILGRLVSETTSSNGMVKYGYNEINVRKLVMNARGQRGEYTIDVMGKITDYSCPEGTVSYTYDANGNVLTVTDQNGTVTRTYDKLNRVLTYADTFGKTIKYEYDEVGNLTKLTYPDNTAVVYTYDGNNRLKTVTDWANRVTSYIYNENGMVLSVVKPDGSVEMADYDDAQRLSYTIVRAPSNAIICGTEYSYDNLNRIIEEKDLAKTYHTCYTYDDLSRVTERKVVDEATGSQTIHNYAYDAAGNLISGHNICHQYDTNNRMTVFDGEPAEYDADGNLLSLTHGSVEYLYEYDSANRLIKTHDTEYTYDAEGVRIRKVRNSENTTYTYNTNAKLSQLLMKTTNGVVTKYVYGLGLIGEETANVFKIHHYDYRGSTVALTDINGNVTDTFKYDTYGKCYHGTGTTNTLFLYNGRDGVVTDQYNLLYMRARYYSPIYKRFINADILHGDISDSTSLNRYSYVNGNPISFVDPFGLSKERGGFEISKWLIGGALSLVFGNWLINTRRYFVDKSEEPGEKSEKSVQKDRWDPWENSIVHHSVELDICTDGPLKQKYGNDFHLYGDHPTTHQETTARLGGYVLPDEINYMVIPKDYKHYNELMYSVGVILNNETGNYVFAIVCEGGPAEYGKEKYGESAWDEVSIHAAWELLNITKPEKKLIGNERQKGNFSFLIFPKADYHNASFWISHAKNGDLQEAIDEEGSKYWR